MKVAMYYNNNDIRLEEMPIPEISEDEILIKVIASGICGSDVMEWYRIKKAPLVLGHEITGEIEKVGKNVKGFKKGERVFVTHHVPCYKCEYCKAGQETVCETLRTTKFYPGGFSEFVRVPKINITNYGVYKLPKEISFEEGTFIEPLGCVCRGQRVANVKKGQTVLVIGSGISGILHIQLAKSKGCKVIATDIDEFRLEMAEKFGADSVLNAKEEIKEKADVVIVCAGAPSAFQQAFKSVSKGGTILFFAMTKPGEEVPMPLWDLWKEQVKLASTYAAVRENLEKAISLIKNKKVNVKDMITHRLPLEETQNGFQLVIKAENSLKVIIEPQK